MSKRFQKNIEKQLIDIVNSRGNENKCGECGSAYPTWASWNLGVLLCGRCASLHRKVLPKDVSKVKSLTLDQWTSEQVDCLKRIGNKKAKKKWNPKRFPFPHDDDDDGPIEEFLKDKYIMGRFRDDNFAAVEYDDKNSRYSGDGVSTPVSGNRLRSRLNSMRPKASDPIPPLSHRKLTTFESTQYSKQENTILRYGYSNRDSILEALLLSNGSIEFALDILDNDAKVNPAQEELPPALPTRPARSTSLLENNPMNSVLGQQQLQTQPSNDWWSNSNASSNTNTGATMPSVPTSATGASVTQAQIYQYTDPVTGQISYIDSNGQQYLDPTNQQHQQMLYQQQNPQLVAQQTNKQAILSLYSQPNQNNSNSAVPNSQQPQQTGFGSQQQQTGFGFQRQPQQPQQTGFGFQQQPQQTGFSGFQPQQTGFAQQPTGFLNFAPQQQQQQPHQQQQYQQQYQQGYWN